MKIIGARFRSHFGYGFFRNRRKIRWLSIFAVLILFFTLSMAVLRLHFMPLAVSMASARARGIANTMINEAVAQRMARAGAAYNELYTIHRASDGRIQSITANMAQVNELKAGLSLEIQEKINRIDMQQAGIPMGSMLKNEFLAGRGPVIPIRLMVVGAVDMELSSSFVSAGVNQTKHEIQLNISLEINSILPGTEIADRVTSSVPVAQTIIVGDVPQAYAHLETPSP